MRNIPLKAERNSIKIFNKESKLILNLYGVYKDTIDPEITYSRFREMYFSKDLIEIDFTCFYHNQVRAGFSAAFFYATAINGKRAFIARSATGLTIDFQGKGLHNTYDLYIKFIRFALKHPVTPIWVCAFVINAFIFRDLCRFIPFIFPKPGKQIPGYVQEVIHTVLAPGDHLPDEAHPFSLQVPIQVKFNEALLQRIMSSSDPNVQWYLKANPRFLDKHGLLVIIGISMRNICGTIGNLISHSASAKLSELGKIIQARWKIIEQKTAILVEAIAKGKIL